MEKTLIGKVLLALALAVFLLLQMRLWFGEGSISDVLKLKRAVAQQQQENTRLKERNRVLNAEVKDLKTGMSAIEEHARQDLGMIKSNETFYLVTGDKEKSPDVSSSSSNQP